MPKTKSKSNAFPLLTKMLLNETIWWDGKSHAYIGLAADGTEVQVGNSPKDVEAYLTVRPNPSQW